MAWAYSAVLLGHSYLRWAVLCSLLAVLVRALIGVRTAGAWTALDERLHGALVVLTDLQFTLGVVLYLVLSPHVKAFFAEPGTAIGVAPLRFFGLEHPVTMLVAVSFVHIGRSRSKKAAAAPAMRHRRTLTWTALALLAMAAAIPWPGLEHGRPLLRHAP